MVVLLEAAAESFLDLLLLPPVAAFLDLELGVATSMAVASAGESAAAAAEAALALVDFLVGLDVEAAAAAAAPTAGDCEPAASALAAEPLPLPVAPPAAADDDAAAELDDVPLLADEAEEPADCGVEAEAAAFLSRAAEAVLSAEGAGSVPAASESAKYSGLWTLMPYSRRLSATSSIVSTSLRSVFFLSLGIDCWRILHCCMASFATSEMNFCAASEMMRRLSKGRRAHRVRQYVACTNKHERVSERARATRARTRSRRDTRSPCATGSAASLHQGSTSVTRRVSAEAWSGVEWSRRRHGRTAGSKSCIEPRKSCSSER